MELSMVLVESLVVESTPQTLMTSNMRNQQRLLPIGHKPRQQNGRLNLL